MHFVAFKLVNDVCFCAGKEHTLGIILNSTQLPTQLLIQKAA